MRYFFTLEKDSYNPCYYIVIHDHGIQTLYNASRSYKESEKDEGLKMVEVLNRRLSY